MAKKNNSKGSLNYDFHNLAPEQKHKVAAVCDQFPEIKKDMVAIVLDCHDFDQDKAIDALTSDGGSSALEDWRNQMESNQVKGISKNKKKNKKKSKKDGLQMSSSAPVLYNDADDSSSLHSSNVDFDPEKDTIKIDDCDDVEKKPETESMSSGISDHKNFVNSSSGAAVKKSGVETPERTDDSSIEEKLKQLNLGEPVSNLNQQQSCLIENDDRVHGENAEMEVHHERSDEQSRHQKHYRQRHTSSQHSRSSVSEDAQSNQLNTPKRGGLMKCKKDLARQTVSLQRIEVQLNSRLEEASKCMKNMFTEVRKLLDKKQADLEGTLNNVREEALSLLKSRQELSAELKRKADRAMNDSDWNDLRAEIKQFVTERKYDDELGKTIWFQWSMDAITEAVNNLGEVCPVKNCYSQRQLSSQVIKNEESVTGEVCTSGKGSSWAADNPSTNDVASDTVSNEEEGKFQKDVLSQSSVQGAPQGSRVFCSSTRYSHSNRFLANHGNRGYYRGGRGGGYPRGRNYDNWQYSGNERRNDYRKQYQHERTDYNHHTTNSSSDNQVHGGEQGNHGNSSYAREGRGQYRGYDRKPYSSYRQPRSQYGKPRGSSRVQRNNSDMSTEEVSVNKNAGIEDIKQHVVNGF